MSATSIACVILVVVMGVDARSAPPVVHRDVDLLSFAMAFGTIAYASCGHPAFPTFQTDMREPAKFGRAVALAYVGGFSDNYYQTKRLEFKNTIYSDFLDIFIFVSIY